MRHYPDGRALRAKHPERNPDSRKPPGHRGRYPQRHHPERHGKESGDQLWVLRLLQLLLQIRVGRLQRGLTPRPHNQQSTKGSDPTRSDPHHEVTPESWTPTFRGSHEKNLQSVVQVRGRAVSSPE